MKVRIFNLEKDLESIGSFLQSRKESHGHDYFNSEDWFKWKFLNSPNGIAIMPTVFENDKIFGANYYGIYPLKKGDKNILGIMPYEAFVHDQCQGKGLFKEMIQLAEITAVNKGVQIMMSFPNKKSIKGFLSSGWNYVPNSITYWLKPVRKLRVLKNILDIKKSFKPNRGTAKNNFEFSDIENTVYQSQIYGYWSVEYLNWRFNELPQAEYIHIKQSSYELVARIGFRGKLKESQILYLNLKRRDFNKKEYKQTLKLLAKETESDLISFPMSNHFPIYNHMKSTGFFKFPSGTQFTYKILDKSLKQNELKFSLCGLDFHTY